MPLPPLPVLQPLPMSSPMPQVKALLLLQPLLLLMPLFLLLLPPAGMIHGLGLLLLLLLTRGYLEGARTSGLSESSSSRPQEPHSPLVQGPADDFSPDLSPASIIRHPIFHCGPITGNSDCSTKEVHSETYYDFPAFAADSELRDSMRLMQRYSLENFMTPR